MWAGLSTVPVLCSTQLLLYESAQLACNSFYSFLCLWLKSSVFSETTKVWIFQHREFQHLLENILLIIVKLPMLHTLHSCCLLYTFAALVVTKYHCVELYWNKGRNNAELCEWERVQRKRRRCGAGLSFSSVLPIWA